MLVMFGQDAVRLAAPTAPAVVSSSPRACTEGWLGFPQSESQLPNMFSAPGILPKNEPKDAKQLKNEDSNNSNDKKKIYWVRREGMWAQARKWVLHLALARQIWVMATHSGAPMDPQI